jgi:ADP-heptose:LPS heptosyltransferase
MKIATMRRIDCWLGRPMCFILTVFRRLRELFGQKPQPEKIHRILFIKLAEQGATVLADAAVRRAVQMVGSENVYFLVFDQNRFIVDVMGIIPEKNVITVSTRNIFSLSLEIIGAIRKIRRLKIDAAVDFEFFARSSAVLTYLSGAAIRVGLHGFVEGSPYRGDLMTHRLNYNPHLHASVMFEMMVEALNQPGQDTPRLNIETPPIRDIQSHFTPGKDELTQFMTILANAAGTVNYSPLILLNSNASDMLPLRRWPTERYAELAIWLLRKSPAVHIAFTGAADEVEKSQKLVEQIGSERCFSMTGKTTLKQLMMLYCLADLLITNDSGPAHFAALTDIKVVTLFGPETPKLFGAVTPRSNILWKNIPCSPCVSAYNNRFSTCNDNACMKRISVDEVFNLVCGLCNL